MRDTGIGGQGSGNGASRTKPVCNGLTPETRPLTPELITLNPEPGILHHLLYAFHF